MISAHESDEANDEGHKAEEGSIKNIVTGAWVLVKFTTCKHCGRDDVHYVEKVQEIIEKGQEFIVKFLRKK